MNLDVVAVDTVYLNVYDFLMEGESREGLLERANKYRLEQIETYTRLVKDYPDREDFKNNLTKAKKVKYEVMSFDEFQALQKKWYISKPLKEITAEEYDYALNVLPPYLWCTIDGVKMFCMSEMLESTFTSQYAIFDGKYYTKIVDCADKSTWIHNYLK